MKELTIIIPCYNCEKTLEETVESCFNQSLQDFEIILVDDKSTDSTREIIVSLKNKYKNIRFFSHEKNLGGGATRNTAISHSDSDVIFCLDSDDILPPNTLRKMLDYLKAHAYDGVVFSGSIKFSNNIKKGKKQVFELPTNRNLHLTDFVSGNAWGTGANFMYKKSVHTNAGGYPEYHNLDTQGFGVRVLMTNSNIHVCPESFFYQRQFIKRYSYFERSYNSGEFSIGYYFILREIFHLLTDEAQKKILSFDIFKKNILGKSNKNLIDQITQWNKEKSIFNKTIEKLIKTDSRNEYLSENPDDLLVLSIHNLIHKKYNEYYLDLLTYNNKNTEEYTNLIYEILFSILKMKKNDVKVNDVNNIISKMYIQQKDSSTTRPNTIIKIIRKILKIN